MNQIRRQIITSESCCGSFIAHFISFIGVLLIVREFILSSNLLIISKSKGQITTELLTDTEFFKLLNGTEKD